MVTTPVPLTSTLAQVNQEFQLFNASTNPNFQVCMSPPASASPAVSTSAPVTIYFSTSTILRSTTTIFNHFNASCPITSTRAVPAIPQLSQHQREPHGQQQPSPTVIVRAVLAMSAVPKSTQSNNYQSLFCISVFPKEQARFLPM